MLGASSGFGAATTRALASAGVPVVGVHLDPRSHQDRVIHLADELRDLGARFELVNGNALKERVRSRAMDAARDLGGGEVLLLLHSLAFGALGALAVDRGAGRVGPRQLGTTLDVMAHSLVWWVRGLVDAGLLNRGARVLAMTSEGARSVVPDYGPVAAAKAALEAHLRQLAVELAPMGITVNGIQAGVTDTPALRVIPAADELLEGSMRRNPSGRITLVHDVSRVVVALLDPAFDWVTGNIIKVDGGESLVP